MIDVTKLKPCGDKLLIKPDPVEEKTAGGIIVLDPSVVDLHMGTIVAMSDGYPAQNGNWVDITKQHKVGDRVAYQFGSAAPVARQPEYAYLQMAAILGKEEVGCGLDCQVISHKEFKTEMQSLPHAEYAEKPDAPGC